MTKGERNDLSRLVRQRARVQKADVDQRAAQLIADFELQMDARYAPEDEAWRDLTTYAQQVVKEADSALAARCADRGIPQKFRPHLHCYFANQGENGSKERRIELRRIAHAELESRARRAKVEIDRHEAALQTQLVAGAIESSDAHAFLAAMPAIDALLPALSLPALEDTLGRQREGAAR